MICFLYILRALQCKFVSVLIIIYIQNWLFCTDLHAALPDFLDEVARVGRGF